MCELCAPAVIHGDIEHHAGFILAGFLYPFNQAAQNQVEYRNVPDETRADIFLRKVPERLLQILLEKAIQASDIGINPQSDGKVIRMTFPQLTEERRKELVKEVSKMAEETKITVRSIRRDAIEKLKAMEKKAEISEDDLKKGEKKTQDLTDKYCKEIDSIFEKKQKEIMEI